MPRHFAVLCPRSRADAAGQTFSEVLISVGILGIVSVAFLGIFLGMNRNAANLRAMNLAKAEVMSRIHEIATVSYSPDSDPAVVPTILNVGTSTSTTDIGSTDSSLGSVPATVTWKVTAEPNLQNAKIRRIVCTIAYNFQGRSQTYEMATMRAPD